MPKGNYAIIKGNEADNNARFLRGGYDEIIGDAVKAGDIKIVGEEYTDGWKPDNAQTNMEGILTANDNKVDAVLSENDGMAGGVIAALKAQGLAGKVPVSGQDGDQAALNSVALGNQTVSVWKDARELGKAAGEAAIRCARTRTSPRSPGTAPFTTPRNNTVTSHPAQAAADPEGQPPGRRRRRLDHQGRPVQGRRGRVRPRLRLIALLASICALPRGSAAGRARSYPEPSSEAPR